MATPDEMCVNALNGLISFLLSNGEVLVDPTLKSVNALSGLISFLRVEIPQVKIPTGMCQCPKRAYLISTAQTAVFDFFR